MKRAGKILALSSLLALGITVGCSGDEGSDSDNAGGANGSGTGNTGGSGSDFRDVDGDGVLDPLTSQDFDEAGVPISQDDIEELRGEACSGWAAEPEPLPTMLMFVVDISGSMTIESDTSGGRSKWEVTEEALREAIDSLPASTPVGILYYPTIATDANPDGPARDASFCMDVDNFVPVAPLGDAGSEQRQAIEDSLDRTEPDRGSGTPTHNALVEALAELERTQYQGNQNIVLITDGQPTFSLGCIGTGMVSDPVDPSPIIDEIAAAEERGITTFLIGSPGSEETESVGEDARPWLSEAAEAGNSAQPGCSHDGDPYYCHFDMVEEPDFGEGLSNALASIFGQILACDYVLPEPPPGETLDTDAINLVLYPDGGDPIQILRSPDGNCTQGWYFDEATDQVRFCDETCDLIQSDPQAALEVLLGCESAIILPE